MDGLDEFHGSPQDIITLFKGSALNSTSLKLVLSSRPEAEFIEAVRNTPNLRLEDLTAEDIRDYVQGHLYSNSRVTAKRNINLARKLLETIVERASGVFLWVVIVVRSLLVGLADGSCLEELEQAVEDYPGELSELYEHMFNRMKSSHRVQASRLFQCVMCCLEIENELPSPLRLSFMDQDGVDASLDAAVECMTVEEIEGRVSDIGDQLRSHCCGYLKFTAGLFMIRAGLGMAGIYLSCTEVYRNFSGNCVYKPQFNRRRKGAHSARRKTTWRLFSFYSRNICNSSNVSIKFES